MIGFSRVGPAAPLLVDITGSQPLDAEVRHLLMNALDAVDGTLTTTRTADGGMMLSAVFPFSPAADVASHAWNGTTRLQQQ